MRKQHTKPAGDALCSGREMDEGERRFRSLADALPQMVWITKSDGTVEYRNQRWITYTGLTLEQSLGEGWWRVAFHPDDLQLVIDRWTSALHSGEMYEHEYRLRRASD